MPRKSASMIAWCEPMQAEFLRAIAAAADLAVVGGGSPSRGQTTTVAGMLGCEPVDDLRQSLSEPRADILLILSPPDLDFARLAPTSMKIATIEPIPDSALAPVAGDRPASASGTAATPVHFMPLVRFSKPLRSAPEMLGSFGEAGVVVHESLGMPGEGTLGARLFAAMDLVHLMLGEPDTIDAALAPPSSRSSGPGAAEPGETLAGLHGTVTANLRFSGRRAAAVVASNQAGRWNNTTTIIGPGGRIRLFDDGFEWIDPGGRKLDEMRSRRSASRGSGSPSGPDSPRKPTGKRASRSAEHIRAGSVPAVTGFSPACVGVLADSIRRLLEDTLFPEPPADVTAALAMGQAALLSCRTGQPESPATIRRMLNAV
ncbi:MAG: hypothetical protein KF787_05300 [Phycisphaeraceae bacterium]|nr:hypothetical protein [Phycisphaerae bacterium]MBX3392047.1 hypothetical protein [Phycisphaeraceae bacterium]